MEDVAGRERVRLELQSSTEFLEMKIDRNEAHNGFNAKQRECFESP